jgi:AcrR family transcriptional regulator
MTTHVRRTSSGTTADPAAPADAPALRSDAARNRASILRAAGQAFGEGGTEVGVEEIAQRAGVGVGTLYRRFPTKESLIDAVVRELLGEVRDVARSALLEGAGTGFATFLRASAELQVSHRGCLARLWNDPAHDPLREEIESLIGALLDEARTAGTVRSDVVYEDVVVLLWSIRGVVESTASVAPDAWRRHIDMLLVAVRPDAPAPSHPPMTAGQLRAVLDARPPAPVQAGRD